MDNNLIAKKANEIQSNLDREVLYGILSRIRNMVEYSDNATVEELLGKLRNIADPDKWDYIGLLSEKDRAVRDTVTYLLSNKDKVAKEQWKTN